MALARPRKQRKRCETCGALKPVAAFFKSTSRRDGYSAQCKDCANHHEQQKGVRTQT